MKYISKIICLLLSVTVLFTASGCDKTKDAYIYFELPETPITLDPQIASSDAELIVVRNIFEGLLRIDKDGKIENGVAKKYSKDGLVYTFELQKNQKWSNGEKITAYDFEFALKRAVLPKTKAPFVSRLFSIKGAKDVYNGLAQSNSIGVNAVDNDTLKITLEYDDADFLETLTTSIAMPCNQSFFEKTDGKYGTSADNLIYNGSYEMKRWRKEVFGIRLYKNELYEGNFKAQNAAVFITCNKDKDTLEQLEKENIDIAFVDSTLTSKAEKIGLKTEKFENICWVLTIGKEFPSDMRKAFFLLVSGDIYSNDLPEGYRTADSIFPKALSHKSSIKGMTVYNKEAGKKLYLKQLEKFEDNKFPSDKVLYFYDNGNIKPVITDIVGHWQSNFSAFVNIEADKNPQSLITQLEKNSYPFAVFPIKADSSFFAEYLSKFGVTDLSQSVENSQIEILKNNTVLPIMFQNTVIAYSPTIVEFNAGLGNGYIDFAYIVKKA